MNKNQKSYLEMRINDIWYVIDRNGDNEDLVKRLCGELEGIRIVLSTFGYTIMYDVETGKHKIVTEKQFHRRFG